MSDYEDLMKRCQRGATNINDANNLLAECYGMMGKLAMDNKSLIDAVEYGAGWFQRVSSADGSGHADLAVRMISIAGSAIPKKN